MTLSLEPIDVKSMVAHVFDTLGPILRQKNNVVTGRVSPDLDMMHADLMKTRTSSVNLLSNAAKFTRDGAITLGLLHVPRDAGRRVHHRQMASA